MTHEQPCRRSRLGDGLVHGLVHEFNYLEHDDRGDFVFDVYAWVTLCEPVLRHDDLPGEHVAPDTPITCIRCLGSVS